MRRRTVLTLLVVVTVVLAGCAGDGGSSTATTTDTTTTGTPVPDQDADEIRDEAVAAMDEVETYRAEINQTATVGGNVDRTTEATVTGVYDREARELRENQTTTAMGRTRTATTYLVDRTMYLRSEAFVRQYSSEWVKLNLSELPSSPVGNFSTIWELSDKLGRQREVLRVANVEYVGTETVDGTETHVLAADVNGSQYEQLAEGLVGGVLSGDTSYTVHEASFRFWIAADTSRPVQSEGTVNLTVSVRGQEVTQNISFVSEYYGYDEPASIDLPPASENAVPLFGDGESDGDEGDTETGRVETPQVAFDFEYDADAGTVSIAHQGGDAIEASNTERLEVRVNDGEDASEWELPVQAGDRTTVPASPGDTVRVVWVAPDDDVTQVLAEFEVPDSDDE